MRTFARPNKRNDSGWRNSQVYYAVDRVAFGALHRSRARFAISYILHIYQLKNRLIPYL